MNKILLALMAFYYFYVLLLGITMLRKRIRYAKKGLVDPKYFKDYQGTIPKELKVWENHFNSQFQLPIIFLIVSTLAITLEKVNLLFCVFAFAFVASRLGHSFIHLTSNRILLRAPIFFLGAFLISFMWIVLLV